jgi:hypothetical protein
MNQMALERQDQLARLTFDFNTDASRKYCTAPEMKVRRRYPTLRWICELYDNIGLKSIATLLRKASFGREASARSNENK